ncbi:MAG: prohibitin family protein [Gammaproteobacteria bacterium]|nr:prohibitin family protein [Gammaproteobacteria bacterium]
MDEDDGFKAMAKLLKYGFIALFCIIGFLIANPFVIIDAGERGVVRQFGSVQDDVWDEGLHLKMPIRDKIAKMDVKTQKYEIGAAAASKDMQVTTTTVAVNYHLLPEDANVIYQEVGITYEEKLIAPAIQEVVKAATAKYEAEELITKRPMVKDDIEQAIQDKMRERGIIVETVYITNFDFSPDFNLAIEAKVKAEQMAQQAENDLIRIEVEARQKVTQAGAEAESIRLIEEQLSKSPQYVEYLSVMKWNGVLPQVTGGAVPFVQLNTT